MILTETKAKTTKDKPFLMAMTPRMLVALNSTLWNIFCINLKMMNLLHSTMDT